MLDTNSIWQREQDTKVYKHALQFCRGDASCQEIVPLLDSQRHGKIGASHLLGNRSNRTGEKCDGSAACFGGRVGRREEDSFWSS